YGDEGPADWSICVDQIVYGDLEYELRGDRRVSRVPSPKRSASRRPLWPARGRPVVTRSHVLDELAWGNSACSAVTLLALFRRAVPAQIVVHRRRDDQRQHHGCQKAAYHRDRQRLQHLRAGADGER